MRSVRPKHDPSRTTPVGLIRYSAEFLEAALAADDKMGTRAGHEFIAPIPVMFLVGQSLELSLKAFLLSRGVDLETLKDTYGHQLHRLLKKSKELGLLEVSALKEDEMVAIEVLDRLYSKKELQYIVTGAKEFPVFGLIESAALKLVYAVGDAVGYAPKRLPSLA